MAKRPDNMDPTIAMDNYEAIHRLTVNFAKYIEEQKIQVSPLLIAQLVNRTPKRSYHLSRLIYVRVSMHWSN